MLKNIEINKTTKILLLVTLVYTSFAIFFWPNIVAFADTIENPGYRFLFLIIATIGPLGFIILRAFPNISFLLMFGILMFYNSYNLEKEPKVHKLTLETKSLKNTEKQILFFGNSLTSSNNLPKSVCEILNSGAQKSKFACVALVSPGRHLKQSAIEPSLFINNYEEFHDWDYLILQEQSMKAGLPLDNREFIEYREAVTQIAENFAKEETIVGIFQTWGFQKGFQDFQPGRFFNFKTMQNNLTKGFKIALSDLNERGYNAIFLPVGDVYSKIHQSSKDPFAEQSLFHKLYTSDRHPTALASFLAALTIAKEISPKDYKNSLWLPAGISEEQSKTLRFFID